METFSRVTVTIRKLYTYIIILNSLKLAKQIGCFLYGKHLSL